MWLRCFSNSRTGASWLPRFCPTKNMVIWLSGCSSSRTETVWLPLFGLACTGAVSLIISVWFLGKLLTSLAYNCGGILTEAVSCFLYRLGLLTLMHSLSCSRSLTLAGRDVLTLNEVFNQPNFNL